MKKILVHYYKVVFLSVILTILPIQSQAEQISVIRHDSYFSTEISFYDQDNQKRFLEEYEGNVVLLVFWASWCGGCVDELPKLDNLQKDFRKLPFKVVALSEDNQNLEYLKNYFTQKEIRYLEIFQDRNSKLMTNLIVAGLPTAYLIDIDGKLKAEFRGNIKWESDEVRKIIIAEFKDTPELPRNSFKHKQFFENVKPIAIDSEKSVPEIREESKQKEILEQQDNLDKEEETENAK
jgi:thiol-disulfide isomerase/thioredoxin